MSNETLPVRISKLEKDIAELNQAIELCKHPPEYKIDESQYPALTEVRRFLAEAQSKKDAETRLALLQDRLMGSQQELEGLQRVVEAKQEKITKLKAGQAKAFERYQTIESELLQQLKLLIGYGQAIADEDAALTQPCKPGAILAANSRMINRLMDVQIADGRVVLSCRESGLFEFLDNGWGGVSPSIPDFQELIQEQPASKEAA